MIVQDVHAVAKEGEPSLDAEQEGFLVLWIVPLVNRIDYLTLHTGRKIEIPFDVLVVFSTNLPPYVCILVHPTAPFDESEFQPIYDNWKIGFLL